MRNSGSGRTYQIQKRISSSEEQDISDSERSESTRAPSSCSSFSLRDCLDELKARNISSNFPETRNESENEDFINQNLSNKQNEKLSKPCRNGACYCFTSDSDEVRLPREANDLRQKSRVRRMSDNHGTHSTETKPMNRKKTVVPEKIVTRNGQTIKAISTLKEVDDSDAPFVHIIQEIHKNCVISEVRVKKAPTDNSSKNRKSDESSKKKTRRSCPEMKRDRKIESYNISDLNVKKNESQPKSSRSSTANSKKGGRLLEKRLSNSGSSVKHKEVNTAPRKPPRSFKKSTNSDSYSQTSSLRDAEKILDEFLRSRGYPIETIPKEKTEKRTRKSYPLEKDTKTITNNLIRKSSTLEKPAPSCPSLSDLLAAETSEEKSTFEIGWKSKEISDMLNYDRNPSSRKPFESSKPQAESQKLGWTIPPKLDIDTVDSVRKSTKDTDDFNNLVQNIEVKATPMKAEIIHTNSKFDIKDQWKNIVSASPWKKKSPKTQKIPNSSTDGLKTKSKEGAKNFLNTSKTKLKSLVFKKSGKSPKTTTRTIGSQTQASYIASTESIPRHPSPISVQSPPGSYFSKTPSQNEDQNTEKFDFKRDVQPPKKERTHRQLTFSPQKSKEKKSGGPQLDSYKSYDKDIDRDLTLIKMGDILGGIKARLEASDERAIQTFREIERREQALADEDDIVLTSTMRVSSEADVHNDAEPIYSEIEEESFIVTGNASLHNLTQVEHFIAGNNPEAIYAQVRKTPKKISTNTRSTSINNLYEQHSPPKCRNASKTNLSQHSAIFFDNLSTAKSSEYLEKVDNIDMNEVYAPLASVETFGERHIDDEDDDVSYESANATYNQIELDEVHIEQSTPKKPTFVSKFTDKNVDTNVFGYDTVDGISVDTAPKYDEINLTGISIGKETLAAKLSSSSNTSLLKYKHFKNKLRKSFRKSRDYIKHESKRLSNSLKNNNHSDKVWDQSTLGLSEMYLLENTTSGIHEQLEQAVSLCRQLPELENSTELAEAERLLLFSTLKGDVSNIGSQTSSPTVQRKSCILIEGFEIPIKTNINEDQFFKYFFTGVFSNGCTIQSTESTENGKNLVHFRNCNILLEATDPDCVIKCDVYMLRLRKIITTPSHVPISKSLSADSSGSSDEIVSRFRLQGTYTIKPEQFVPFQIQRTRRPIPDDGDDKFYMQSDQASRVPFTRTSRNTNLLDEVTIRAKLEIAFPKFHLEGFLNLEDTRTKHNWNRRWCRLDNLELNAWDYPQDVPLKDASFSIDLSHCLKLEATLASRSECARPRSFYLATTEGQSVFFSCDSQTDLDYWLSGINVAFKFVATWMRSV